MKKRTIIIGDIHGTLDEFKELIELCQFKPGTDTCISTGDLVDRGPNSAGVIDFAMELGATVTVGNHEDKYIRYHHHEVKKTKTVTKTQ